MKRPERAIEAGIVIALGAAVAATGVTHSDTNATIIGVGSVMAGIHILMTLDLKHTIETGVAAIVATQISDEFGKTLNTQIQEALEQINKEPEEDD